MFADDAWKVNLAGVNHEFDSTKDFILFLANNPALDVSFLPSKILYLLREIQRRNDEIAKLEKENAELRSLASERRLSIPVDLVEQ